MFDFIIGLTSRADLVLEENLHTPLSFFSRPMSGGESSSFAKFE